MRYGCTEPWKKICLFHFTIMGVAILKLKSRLKSTANLSTILCFWIIEVDFNKLVCTERVGKVKKFAELYGCDRGRVKGLVFCSRKEEAKRLSQEFNKLDYRTISLDGESSEELREESIIRLEQENA